MKRYAIPHELSKESMSTAVDCDKCRDCDAAISEVSTTNAGTDHVSEGCF